MAEGEAKQVSPRGSFFIGLVTGLGIAFMLFMVLQQQRSSYDAEVGKLKLEVMKIQKQMTEDKAELYKYRGGEPVKESADK
jgi:hypothetical protein